MRTFGWLLGRILLLLAALAVAVWFWPQPGVGPVERFDPALPGDLDAHLAAREAVFGDITPGAEKRILWAGEPGVKTDLALVYLHGFSATSEEIRPVPDRVAEALGANLYFARLAGHGRDGAAMAGATAEDWLTDLAEALAIAARLGERTVLIGASTGATLAMAGLGDPALADALPQTERVAGLVLISPNIRLRPLVSRLLDLPLAERWGPWATGGTVGFTPVNEGHARWWTYEYPTAALFPMARLTRHLRGLDPAAATLPALFVYSDADRVIDPARVRAAAARWGGPARIVVMEPGPGDDPYAHIPGGDILSPGLTDALTAHLVEWTGGL